MPLTGTEVGLISTLIGLVGAGGGTVLGLTLSGRGKVSQDKCGLLSKHMKETEREHYDALKNELTAMEGRISEKIGAVDTRVTGVDTKVDAWIKCNLGDLRGRRMYDAALKEVTGEGS